MLTGCQKGFEQTVEPAVRRGVEGTHLQMRGSIALAEGQWHEAIQLLQRSVERPGCFGCRLVDLGRAYDGAGQRDSAVVLYERYLSMPALEWGCCDVLIDLLISQSVWRPSTLRRLAELHEERGEREKAIDYYNKFIDLWQDADPELQPQVEEVKQRLARLVGESQ